MTAPEHTRPSGRVRRDDDRRLAERALLRARRRPRGAGTWYAPFVLRPRRLGAQRVAIVLPTNTWQAYNYEDGDSWYLDPSVHTIDLDASVPRRRRPAALPRLRPRLHPLARAAPRAGRLPLRRRPRRASARGDGSRATTSSSSPGHEEYVTKHEFDVVQRYRDLGGNLAFLSANDFFYAVSKHGDRMDGRRRWRDIGRPEAVARRRAVRRLEPRRLSEPAVSGHRHGRGAVALPRHRPAQRRARSASTGSRSTPSRRHRRPGRRCSHGSPTSSARASRPR